MQVLEEHRCQGGTLGYYKHEAETTGCAMRFTVFVPSTAAPGGMPVLWWLSGLTCTEDNFTVKAGAYRAAAEHEVIIVAPDTSPRGEGVPDDDAYDLGQGAGFYLDATELPWSQHFNMYSYITRELQDLYFTEFLGDSDAQGVFGHSMGGHGALTIALKNPDTYKSVSAFAPICAPIHCPWGRKAFAAYLGDDESAWRDYDAAELMKAAGSRADYPAILVDQGSDDPFLAEQLLPDRLVVACEAANQELHYREHDGYDHSYFFISTFIDDHIRHHAEILRSDT